MPLDGRRRYRRRKHATTMKAAYDSATIKKSLAISLSVLYVKKKRSSLSTNTNMTA